jgi:DNA (cytosine-5)-methyltransferase 1
MRPVLLDLFCGAGGAGMGYYQAGFDVVGIDIELQLNYPFIFYQREAIKYLLKNGKQFDIIHASPPCQAYSRCARLNKTKHPDMIAQVRNALQDTVPNKPWIIENVEGSPLINPILLCGNSFELGTYRHRLFESSVKLIEPAHKFHDKPITKMGRLPKLGEMMHIVGNFSGILDANKAMGIGWMSQQEIREAIPPAYTKYIGEQLL